MYQAQPADAMTTFQPCFRERCDRLPSVRVEFHFRKEFDSFLFAASNCAEVRIQRFEVSQFSSAIVDPVVMLLCWQESRLYEPIEINIRHGPIEVGHEDASVELIKWCVRKCMWLTAMCPESVVPRYTQVSVPSA